MRVIGFDPGAHLGWVALDVARPGARAAWIAAGVLRGEARVRLALELYIEHQPDAVIVEAVEAVYGRDRFGAGMASALLAAERLGGRLYQLAEDHGIPAHTITAAQWRKAITGNGRATDEAIKAAILLRCAGWPKRSNAHERDAAGVAIVGAEQVILGL